MRGADGSATLGGPGDEPMGMDGAGDSVGVD